MTQPRPTTKQNEDDVAAQIVGFLQQFLNVFSELKGKKFHLSGESVRDVSLVICISQLLVLTGKGSMQACTCLVSRTSRASLCERGR